MSAYALSLGVHSWGGVTRRRGLKCDVETCQSKDYLCVVEVRLNDQLLRISLISAACVVFLIESNEMQLSKTHFCRDVSNYVALFPCSLNEGGRCK